MIVPSTPMPRSFRRWMRRRMPSVTPATAWYTYQQPASAARSRISSSSLIGWEIHFFLSGLMARKRSFSHWSFWARELSTKKRRLLSMPSSSRTTSSIGRGRKRATAEVRRAAGEAVEAAAARGVDEVDHLHAAEAVARRGRGSRAGPGRSRRVSGSWLPAVVDRGQPAGLEVAADLGPVPLDLAQEDGVGVAGRLLGVQVGADAAEEHGHALGPEAVGDLPGARHLAGEHRGDRDQVGPVVEVDLLDVLVAEARSRCPARARRRTRPARAAADGSSPGAAASANWGR